MKQCLAIVAGLTSIFLGCSHSGPRQSALGGECAAHLRELAVLLRQSIPAGDEYPPKLIGLHEETTNTSLFLCPSVGHRSGRFADIETWSDYIYVGNLPLYVGNLRVAQVICPAENHHDGYGYVLWLSGDVEKVDRERIHKLVAEPWCEAGLTSQREAEKLRQRVVVSVPPALRRLFLKGSSSGSDRGGGGVRP